MAIWRLLMTLRDKLDSLGKEERRRLMYAFEHEFTQMVKLPENKFIGVNIKPSKSIKIIEEAGCWSYGEINDNAT